MNGVACLTLTEQLDGSWVWTAYNKHGQTLLRQDRCHDLAHAAELSLTAIASITVAAPASESPRPRPKAKPAASPRRRRKRA